MSSGSAVRRPYEVKWSEVVEMRPVKTHGEWLIAICLFVMNRQDALTYSFTDYPPLFPWYTCVSSSAPLSSVSAAFVVESRSSWTPPVRLPSNGQLWSRVSSLSHPLRGECYHEDAPSKVLSTTATLDWRSRRVWQDSVRQSQHQSTWTPLISPVSWIHSIHIVDWTLT